MLFARGIMSDILRRRLHGASHDRSQDFVIEHTLAMQRRQPFTRGPDVPSQLVRIGYRRRTAGCHEAGPKLGRNRQTFGGERDRPGRLRAGKSPDDGSITGATVAAYSAQVTAFA